MTKRKVSLRRYFEEKFIANEKSVALALEAQKVKLEAVDKATEVSKDSLEKRLETMNEFRETIADQQKTFITRPEHDLIITDIRSLRESRAEITGKADQNSVNVALLFSIFSLFVAILGVVIIFIRK